MPITSRDLELPESVRRSLIQATSQFAPPRNIPTGPMSIAPGPQSFANQSIAPPTPTAPPAIKGSSQGLEQSLQNIIATGKATPQMATLLHPTTGDRQPVQVGSAQAQMLFGQGYVLEQSPGVPISGAVSAPPSTAPTTPTAPIPTTPAPPSKLSILGGEQARIRKEAFESVYGFTPDEWQNLLPDAQRRLRNQRVQDLAGQLGDVNTAITTVKQEIEDVKAEEEKTYDRALETLNSYLEYGVIDSLPEDQLAQLAQTTGMNVEALRKISEQNEKDPGGEFKLEQLGSDLYAIRLNPKTGDVEKKLVQRGRTGGGGRTSDFEKAAQGYKEYILAKKLHFIDAFNALKVSFPEVPDEQIDKALGGSFKNGVPTGTATVLPEDASVIQL